MSDQQTTPWITCICPTYKRPDHLRNALACYAAQDYQHRNLIVMDDAGQHAVQAGQQGAPWLLLTVPHRYSTLPDKLAAMINIAIPGTSRRSVPWPSQFVRWSGDRGQQRPDIVAIWEDDDIYLPTHLAQIADAWRPGERQYFVPSTVLSTYGQPLGGTQVEQTGGRFHASWAYSVELLGHVGYPETDRLDFDQQMGATARRASNATVQFGGATPYGDLDRPTYCYRWGNGIYHGSQAGEEGYRDLWDRLGRMPAPPVRETGPMFDAETRAIYRSRGFSNRLECATCRVPLEQWESSRCERCEKKSPVGEVAAR
jgi:hypothetical protein